jgi:hypothetical protein
MSEHLFEKPFDGLEKTTQRRLLIRRRAARDLFEILESFAAEGRHPVRDVVTPTDTFTCWEHYPPADVEDTGTGCAWYYHAHDPAHALPWDEHGHFHCFMYTERLGRTAKPIALPSNPDYRKGGLVHLAAVSFDAKGTPIRLFIPNRWVTDEWLYPARDVIALIDCFCIISDQRYELTNRFLAAILRLFHPHISAALRERDRIIEERGRGGPQRFTEDRSVAVVSSIAFDLDASLAALEHAWEGSLALRKDRRLNHRRAS